MRRYKCLSTNASCNIYRSRVIQLLSAHLRNICIRQHLQPDDKCIYELQESTCAIFVAWRGVKREKMKDDITETIRFIKEIENLPQLYDHTTSEYSNRRTTEIAWAKIGKKFDTTGKYNVL